MLFVTGATGFIGRSLMTHLERSGIDAAVYSGRMNDPLTLREQLQGMDTVIHLAGSEARGRSRLLQHVDIEGTERLIEESRRAGIKRLIVVSRLGADHHSWHALLRAKGEVERLVAGSGIPYTIVRASSLYGHGDRYFELIVSMAIWSWPFVWLPGGGRVPMQPLWVEDFTRCLLLILQQQEEMTNRVITVAGSEQVRYKQLVERLLAAAGIRRIPLRIPLVLLRPTSNMLFGWWYWPAVSRFFADRFFVPEVTDHDIVLRTFGFHPRRYEENLNYLRRAGLRWRMFRR